MGLGARIDRNIEGVVQVARRHWTKAGESVSGSARVDGLAHNPVAIGSDFYIEENVTLDGGGGRHVDGGGVVIWRIDDIEQTGGEAGIGLAGAERGCLEDIFGGNGEDEAKEAQEDEGQPLCPCESHIGDLKARTAARGRLEVSWALIVCGFLDSIGDFSTRGVCLGMFYRRNERAECCLDQQVVESCEVKQGNASDPGTEKSERTLPFWTCSGW